MDYNYMPEYTNMWNGLFKNRPFELLNLNFLPYILDTMEINDIIKKIFEDLKTSNESKYILARIKLLEILIDKVNTRDKSIYSIIKNKYYRDTLDIFKNNKDPIIKMTVGISIIKKLHLYSNNNKLEKYYKLAQKINNKKKYILVDL